MLTQEDKDSILSDFPNIKLSYETVVHKKVYNCDIILAIPAGTKCFAWFTIFDNKYVCILFELENNKKKEIKNIRIINTCFSKSLCDGTIVYGTLFNHMNNNFFSIEDIFLYKDKNLSRENWDTKFNTIIKILKYNIKQTSYNKHIVVFGLPIIAYSNEKMDSILKSDIKYDINCVQYYQSNKPNSYLSIPFNEFNNIEVKEQISKDIKDIKDIKEPMKTKEPIKTKEIPKEIERIPKYIVLEVKPDIQNDIYNLYCSDNSLCGIACIPDYKTSTMMNKLFRIIKENDDLDKLEESDDEDEFENPNIDKFVYLEKSLKMKCYYNKRFKKWTPVEVMKSETAVNNNCEINNFISNLYDSNKKTYYKKNNYCK
jgi:hypothetical protein